MKQLTRLSSLLVFAGILSACSTAPENRIQTYSDESKKLSAQWNKGSSMVEEGKSLIKKGKKQIDDGHKKIDQGEDNIAKGEDLIDTGTSLMHQSETSFDDLTQRKPVVQ